MMFQRIIKISYPDGSCTRGVLQTKIGKTDLAEKIIEFEEDGYEYNLTNDLIKTPENKVYSELDIEEILTPLKFGNKEQLKILKALEYLQLVREYHKD